MKPNTTTAAFGFCIRYAKAFINQNISFQDWTMMISVLLGFPGVRIYLSQSSQHTYEERVAWSGHDKAQAKGKNKEREGDDKQQTFLFHQVS